MIVIIWGIIALPTFFSAPPRYDYIYSVGPGYKARYTYKVIDRKIIKVEPSEVGEHYNPPRLYYHSVTSNVSKEVSFEDAETYLMSGSTYSPDGYRLIYDTIDYDYSSYTIFFPFTSGSKDSSLGYVLEKNRKLVQQNLEEGQYSSVLNFIGWVLDTKDSSHS